MRALIVGLGSIGRRHYSNLRKLDPAGHVTVWRQPSRAGEDIGLANQPDYVVFSLEDAIATRPEIALITGPSSRHVSTGMELADQGIQLFIEKPLSNTMEGVTCLLDRCRQRGVVLLVGYNFRFYEPLLALRQALLEGRIGRVLSVRAEVGQYLPDWRPTVDYRISVSARAELGGGVLLELSHEIDYVRWLVGEISEVSARIGRLGDLDTDVEDIAELLLDFECGAIGSIHMDMLQRSPSRTCRVIGSEGTLVWDGLTHEVRCFRRETGHWTILHEAPAFDRNEMYVEELRHFIKCATGLAKPEVTGIDGERVLQVVLAARRSSLERRTIPI